MPKYTINIGLDVPATGVANSVDHTLTLALHHVSDVQNVAVRQSNTERTVVIDFNVISGSLQFLSDALGQDCVAVYDHDATQGFLIGAKADAWGEFNLDYFIFI